MKIFLSTKNPQDSKYKWVNNLSMLNDTVLDAEATEIICEDFLSSFSIDEQIDLINIITAKMRLNGMLVISEVDANLLSKRFYLEEIDINEYNKITFETAKRKSLLSINRIIENLPSNIKLINKHYAYNQCRAVLKCRRVK